MVCSRWGRRLRLVLLATAAAGFNAAPALATPTYELLTTIGIPANTAANPAGTFRTYDISFFDGKTQTYYLADRSNAAVDVFSAATNSFVTRIGGFAGQQASNNTSGPDGVLVVNLPGQHQLWAGDGNSTLKGFTIGSGNSYTPIAGTPIATGTAASQRVDEMSFDPQSKHLLVANNAATPPFATLIDSQTNAVVAKITFNGVGTPNATGGIEQSVYNPVTKKFYLSIPQLNSTGPGAVAEINPATGAVTRTIDLASFGISACGPTGLTVSGSGNLLVGCGDPSQSVVLDPSKTGAATLVKTIPQTSGADEVWYDPTTNRYFLADRNNPGGSVLGIIDAATNNLLQNVLTTPGDHSVAVDPISGEVFMPLGADPNNTICPGGCIGVYAESFAVAEPASLPLFAGALVGLFGVLGARRSRRA